MDRETILAVGVFALVIIIIIRDFLANRRLSDAIDGLREANANTKALDLIEPVARKVVPVELVGALFALAGSLATNADQKELVAQAQKFFVQITDGLPNVLPATPPVVPDTSGASG